MKKKLNSSLRKLAAISAAVSLIAANASFTAFAEDSKSFNVDSIISGWASGAISLNDTNNYVVADPKTDTSPLPSKFDLRDVDGKCYVPEIRSQSPFGSCWSFGATAAAEISLAHEYDLDFNELTDEEKKKIDLSEHHLAWFAYDPVHEDDPIYASQAGEGRYPFYNTYDKGMSPQEEAVKRIDIGGLYYLTLPMYSAGIGPVAELDVPYTSKTGENDAFIKTFEVDENGTIQNENYIYNHVDIPYKEYEKALNEVKKGRQMQLEEHPAPGKYYLASYGPSQNADWTVDSSKKYTRTAQLDNASSLPVPATAGSRGEYIYDEKATNAIKHELVEGRGVAIGYLADQSRPGQTLTGGSFMSFRTENGEVVSDSDDAPIWAQYTYDRTYDPQNPDSVNKKNTRISHAVCIVGYDDDFPKEYFNDPNGTIGGNGAWICRNSWGSKDNSVESSINSWGNDGSGYFYLSYYDQSIGVAQSYDFRAGSDDFTVNSDKTLCRMYDHLPTTLKELTYDNDVYMANVFEEENDGLLTDVGLNTVTPNSTVEFEVYLLNDLSKTPTDGEKVYSGKKTFDYGGFHCVKLDKEILIPEGQKYSVVAKLVREDGKNTLSIGFDLSKKANENRVEAERQKYILKNGSDEGFDPLKYCSSYGEAVVNKGESFIGAQGKNVVEWADWKNVSDKMINAANNDVEIDNLPIRAYIRGNSLSVKNTIENPKEVYKAGDVLEGTVTVKNTQYAINDSDIVNIKLTDSLGALDEKDSAIDKLSAGETKTISYKYTITDEDAKAGKLTSTIDVTSGEFDLPYDFVEELAKNSFTVNTTETTEPAPVAGILGDANLDGVLNVRDAAFISNKLSQGKGAQLPSNSDYNQDNKINIRDAASIAKYIISNKK